MPAWGVLRSLSLDQVDARPANTDIDTSLDANIIE
jgi:hypothetical protein